MWRLRPTSVGGSRGVTGGRSTDYFGEKQHFLCFNRLVEFGELGIDLPPLPYDLHPKAGQRKFPAAKHAEEKGEMEEEEEENVVDKQSHPVQIQPFGSYKKEIEAVVIEAEQEKINDGAVGALAGPPVFRRPQMDSNIYHYNTNYNLVKFDKIFILFHLIFTDLSISETAPVRKSSGKFLSSCL